MNKKTAFIFSLFSMMIFLSACGGGGGGGLSTPPDVNPGITTIVRLLEVQNVAQTNSSVFMKAKLSDGTGKPVTNETVSFTKISGVGVLSAPSAVTDSTGVATIVINSETPGATTILASVETGAGQVRDRRTIFFTADGTPPTATMSMVVNSVPGNTIFNETSDFILFESGTDDTVEIFASVFDREGFPVGGGMPVSWFADQTEAVFIRTDDITNVNGQAQAVLRVVPGSIRNTETHLNIAAFAGNGAFNMLTLFLQPVTVQTVIVSAVPSRIASGGTSTISAAVTTNVGTPVPDGTTVNFTISGGGQITPFGQTTNGVATAQYIAPVTPSDILVTVAASTGGKSGSTTVSITGAPDALNVIPASRTVVSAPAAQTAAFIITGGTAPYTTVSNNPLLGFNAATGTGSWTGSNVIVTIPANATAGTVTLTVTDARGLTKTATVNIVTDIPPSVVSTTPGNGGTNVPVNGDIIVVFNKALNPATVTDASFTIFDDTAAAAYVPGCAPLVTYDEITFIATIGISSVTCADLVNDHSYTVTLLTTIRDLAGNPLTAPYVFGFTTVP